jgi:hypothetical protein
MHTIAAAEEYRRRPFHLQPASASDGRCVRWLLWLIVYVGGRTSDMIVIDATAATGCTHRQPANMV